MTYLKKGDVIRLEIGMRVNAEIPEACYFSNVDFSDRTTIVPIEIGKIYKSDVVSKEKYIQYLMSKKEVSSEVISFIASSDFNGYIRKFDTAKYAGEYVVESTCTDGGGTYVDAGGGCTYSSGWHVFAKKIESPKVHVNFYQSGDFSTFIDNISPLYLKTLK